MYTKANFILIYVFCIVAITHSKTATVMPGQNQLLFNLNAQPQPFLSALQIHRPRPIVLDKGGPMAPNFQVILFKTLSKFYL